MDQALEDLLQGEGFSPDNFLLPGVPRIRPVLLLLSAHAAKNRENGRSEEEPSFRLKDIEHIALAGELLYAAIVLHDTALGRPRGRRRRLARRLIGGAVGWMGGNALNLRSIELVHQVANLEILSDLMTAMREVAEARAEWRSWNGAIPTSEEVILYAEQHMGSLFSFTCRSGARLAGATASSSLHLGIYGMHMGVAWYLHEELYQLQGEEGILFLEDALLRHKPLYTLSWINQESPEVSALQELLLKGSSEFSGEELQKNPFVEKIFLQLHDQKALTQTRLRIVQSIFSARKALRRLPQTPHRDALEELALALQDQY
jgi:octaprenyl-diphosphate synthase